MPILGGNQQHDWAYQGDIDKLDMDDVHKHYLKDNDIAGQLIVPEKKLDNFAKNNSLLPRFLKNLNKWLKKENVFVD